MQRTTLEETGDIDEVKSIQKKVEKEVLSLDRPEKYHSANHHLANAQCHLMNT
jgi:hypothetical protein